MSNYASLSGVPAASDPYFQQQQAAGAPQMPQMPMQGMPQMPMQGMQQMPMQGMPQMPTQVSQQMPAQMPTMPAQMPTMPAQMPTMPAQMPTMQAAAMPAVPQMPAQPQQEIQQAGMSQMSQMPQMPQMPMQQMPQMPMQQMPQMPMQQMPQMPMQQMPMQPMPAQPQALPEVDQVTMQRIQEQAPIRQSGQQFVVEVPRGTATMPAGVGIHFCKTPNGQAWQIFQLDEAGTAKSSGKLEAMDWIHAVFDASGNEISVYSLMPEQVTQLILGQPGTVVKMKISKDVSPTETAPPPAAPVAAATPPPPVQAAPVSPPIPDLQSADDPTAGEVPQYGSQMAYSGAPAVQPMMTPPQPSMPSMMQQPMAAPDMSGLQQPMAAPDTSGLQGGSPTMPQMPQMAAPMQYQQPMMPQ